MRDGLATHYGESQQDAAEVHSRVAPARRSAYLARLAENSSAAMSRQLGAPLAAQAAAAS
jgi:RNA polymerase sigma factor for flagellar operon FliA